MATLIAANYQSQSSTAYGFMNTYVGPLKNNTLYTVRCRYKWDKNGTASTCPYAFYLWRSTWTNSYVITNVYNDYTTYVGTFTTPSDASSYDWNISCYANAQYISGVANGAVLSMDWYELWEGDATTFSLTDAYEQGTNNLFKWGDKPSSSSGIGHNGAGVSLESSTFGYNVYKCVSTSASSQMYVFYNSAALSSAMSIGKTYLATAEIYSPDSSACNINIEQSTILASSRSITPGQWSKVWVIGTRNANGGAVTFYAPAGTYYYKNIHIAETPTSFLDLQNSCTNTGYFSTAEPKNALRSWIGYYYKTNTYDLSGALSTTSVTAAANEITINYTIKDIWSNGKKTAKGSVTPTVSSTLGTVSNITATNSSGTGTAKLSIPSRGTTIGAERTGTVTITYEGKSITLSFSQAANAVTSIKAVASNASTNSLHFSYPNGTTLTAAGTTVSPTLTGAAVFYFTSGANSDKIGSRGAHYGGTLSFARSYIESTDVSWASVNSSSGAVTVNANTGAQRTVNIRSTLTVNWGSLSNSLVQFYDCKQNADSISSTTYGNVTKGTITNATIPASGTTTNYTATAGNGSQVLTYSWVSGKANTTETKTIAPSVASISATASSKGTTKSDITTVKSQAVTWSGSGGKSASGTMYIYQAANTCTETTETGWSVDSVSPTSKSVAATSGSFTLSWRQVKRTRTKYSNWSSGATDSYSSWSSWVPETSSRPSGVESDVSWMTVGTIGTSGSDGKNSVTITYTANNGTSSRSGNITISNGAGSGKCAVSQAVDDTTVKSVTIKSVTVNGGALTNPATYAAAGATKTVANKTSPSCTVTLTLTYNSGRTEDTTSYSSYGTLTGPTYSWKVNGSNATGSSSTLSVTMPNNTTASTKSWAVVRTASYTFKLNSTYGGASKSGSNTASTSCTQKAGTSTTTSAYRISKVYADYTDVDKHGGNPYVYVNIEKKTDTSWNGIVTSAGSWTTLTGKQANTDFGSTAPFNLYVNQTGSYSNSAFVTLGTISLTNSTATTAAIYRSRCSIPSNYDAYARTNTISAVLSSNTTNSGYTGEGKNYITITQAANITYTMDIFAKGSNKNSVTVYADIAGYLTFNYPTRESQTDISMYATLYGNSSVGDMFDGYYASVDRDDNLAPYSVTCNLYGNITNSAGQSMSYRGCKLRLVFKSGSTTVYTTDWQTISRNYSPLEWNTTSYEFYIDEYEFPSDVTMWMEFEFGNF